jgi:hypothetical protein
LFYGSNAGLAVKLAFWTAALAQAISPWPLVAAAIATLVGAALLMESVRHLRRSSRDRIETLVSSNFLYVLALVGTALASILTYSLQINEETRFLLPIIPILAVLLSWSLGVFDRFALNVIVISVLATGAIVVESAAFGPSWAGARLSPWLTPYQHDPAAAERLRQAVRLTCARPYRNLPTIIGVEFPELNANSAAFYSADARRKRGYKCSYKSLGYAEADTEKALRRIDDLKARFVVTISPNLLPLEADPFNKVARTVSERLAGGIKFAPVADLGGGVLVYERRSHFAAAR